MTPHTPGFSKFNSLEDLSPVEMAKHVQRLAREFAFLETVFQTLEEGVLVITENGIVNYANKSACTFLSIDTEAIGHQTIRKISPEFAKGLHDLANNTQENTWMRQEISISYPQKRLLKVCSGFFTPKGDLLDHPYWLMILNDITKEKAEAEALFEEEQLESLQLLAGGVAHEIGNPLNSIMLHLQLLESQLAEPSSIDIQDQMQEGLQICKQEVTRLDGIVKHFLKAIRPIKPDFQEMNILDILKEVLLVQKAELEALNINVHISVHNTLVNIKGDPNLLKQALFNIIKNAMEAMDRGGNLTIELSTNETDILLIVKDTGIGMDSGAMNSLFQPFYTTKLGGNGLGMVMVERIVKAHGGKIEIQSVPQQGTSVMLHLPHQERRLRYLE